MPELNLDNGRGIYGDGYGNRAGTGYANGYCEYSDGYGTVYGKGISFLTEFTLLKESNSA